MELYPIREWQEKDGDRTLKSIRLYIGKIHIATVEPTKEDPDMYYCHEMLDLGRLICTSSAQPLEDIKIAIECSLKEFIARLVQPRKLVKMEASPSKQFHSHLKKDGHGKR